MKNKFKIWKTIEIGTGRPELKDINISSYPSDLLSKTKFSTKKRKIDLVKIQVKDLDIKAEYPTTKQIYAKAKKLGLSLVPAEVGPILRDQYRDQELYEWLYIGMKPISDSDGGPHVFYLFHFDDGLWLDNRWAGPDDEWDSDDEFVFSLASSLTLEPSDSLSGDSQKIDTLNFGNKEAKEIREFILEIIKSDLSQEMKELIIRPLVTSKYVK